MSEFRASWLSKLVQKTVDFSSNQALFVYTFHFLTSLTFFSHQAHDAFQEDQHSSQREENKDPKNMSRAKSIMIENLKGFSIT